MPGEAEGIIVGGNLTVLTSLVGTPYELNGKGALLLLEEVGERPYRIDRMLNQLWQSRLLSRVSGILLGDNDFGRSRARAAGTSPLSNST